MPSEIDDLIRKLEPILQPEEYKNLLRRHSLGKFNRSLRKLVEYQVRTFARNHIDDHIIIHPFPMRSAIPGEYSIGIAHYNNISKGVRFGIRGSEFIKHAGIFGATGSGKTTTAIGIIRQLCENRKPFLILDPKGTWQAIIRKHWAKDVKVLKLGSTYAPYTFDPFIPLPGMDEETWIAEIVEVICDSQYLGFGAKALLKRAITAAREKGNLSLRSVHDEFREMKEVQREYKEKSWAVSTLRALETAITGILGRVLTYRENIPFRKLMNSQVVIVMDELVDDDQIAMFMAIMLARIYWHRKIAGIKERFKHLLVMEEFHVMSSADISKGDSRIDFLVRTCREFSQGVLILDQNPGDISQSILGNLNAMIVLNLGTTKDINAVGTAMVLDSDARRYLGKLPTGWAICRVKDRFPESVLVKIDFDVLDKSELKPEEIRSHNGDFVSEIVEKEEETNQEQDRLSQAFTESMRLGKLHRKVLRYLKINNSPSLKDLNLSVGISYGQSERLRNRLRKLGLIDWVDRVPTQSGAETRVFLTEKGEDYLRKAEESRRLGGDWHQGAVEQVARFYEEQGFVVRLEHRDIDVFVDKGDEQVAVEVESLSRSTDVVQAVVNIGKALRCTDKVESVVKDKAAAKKLKEAIEKSPVPKYAPVKIKLLSDY